MKAASASALLLLFAATAFCASNEVQPQPQKTIITSHRFDMKTVGNETRSIFDGTAEKPVTLTGTNIKIVCDHLEVIAVGVGDDDATVPTLEKFKYLLATGRVNIVQGDREAKCGRAEVFPRENKIELTENPVVVDHSTGWTGAGRKITMYRGERRVVIEESEFEGPPIKDLGFDDKQPGPTPAPPKSDEPPPAPAPEQTITVPGITPPQK